MDDSRKLTILCGLLKSCNPSLEEVSKEMKGIENCNRMVWQTESPLICSARLGRQDLVEVLINQFEINPDSTSDQDKDWCALQAAIASNNLQLAKFMVINLGANVDLVKYGRDQGQDQDQSILTLAIQSGDEDLVTFLVKDLEANVDQTLHYSNSAMDKSFSPLLIAIQEDTKRDLENRDWSITRLMLDLDADISKEGWIRIENDWKYGTSIQLSEELARTCTEAEKNSFQILIKLLQDTQRTRELDKTCLTKFENQSASDLLSDVTCKIETLDALVQPTRQKIRAAELKLKEGKNKLAHKKRFQTKLDYLLKQESSGASRSARESIKAAKHVQCQIQVAKSSSDYLDDSTIDKLEKVLACEELRRNTFKAVQSQQKISRELECNICMEVPKLGLHVRSCTNDHLLCNGCFVRVTNCPLCRDDFQNNPPRRSLFAERMISVFHENNPQDQVQNQGSTGVHCDDLYRTMCEALLQPSTSDGDNRNDLEQLQTRFDAAKKIQQNIKSLQSSPDFLTEIDIETRELRQEIQRNDRSELESLLGFFDDQDLRDESEINRLQIDLATAKQKLEKILLGIPPDSVLDDDEEEVITVEDSSADDDSVTSSDIGLADDDSKVLVYHGRNKRHLDEPSPSNTYQLENEEYSDNIYNKVSTPKGSKRGGGGQNTSKDSDFEDALNQSRKRSRRGGPKKVRGQTGANILSTVTENSAEDDEEKVECPMCNVPFSVSTIEAHAARCGDIAPDDIDDDSDNNGIPTSAEQSNQNRLSVKSINGKYVCDFCKSKFTRQTVFVKHTCAAIQE